MQIRNASIDKLNEEAKHKGSNNLDAIAVYKSSINSNHKRQLEKEIEQIQKMNERSLLIKYGPDKKASSGGYYHTSSNLNSMLAGEETINFQTDGNLVRIKNNKNTSGEKKKRSQSSIHNSYGKSNTRFDNPESTLGKIDNNSFILDIK